MTNVGAFTPVALDESLVNRIHELARALGVEAGSFLLNDFHSADADLVRQIADGLTLAFVTHCYHHHPRGENVYELMALEEKTAPNTPEAAALEARIEEAAAAQIPFVVSVNRLLEDYYRIRRQLDAQLGLP
ncbi:MAG: hypothetical protein CFK52_12515 [Chloracidobacterium sp. CP2_5A]|nr:MAG: hypothetical protein CFK52_12515 [Chloracidobacterium sp. CP2_5A]